MALRRCWRSGRPGDPIASGSCPLSPRSTGRNCGTFPNFYDPDAAVASAYGIRGVPTYVFLDKDGRVARTSAGARGVGLIEAVLNELRVE